MKYIKNYKIFESNDIADKIKIIMLCIDEYSKKTNECRYELEIDEQINMSSMSDDSKIIDLIKLELIDGENNNVYCVRYIKRGDGDDYNMKIYYTGINSLDFSTITNIYEYLIKKYPEIGEGEGMGFFNLVKESISKNENLKPIYDYIDFYKDVNGKIEVDLKIENLNICSLYNNGNRSLAYIKHKVEDTDYYFEYYINESYQACM